MTRTNHCVSDNKSRRRQNRVPLLILLLSLWLWPRPAWAQTPVSAMVDRTTIAANEQVTLTVTVSGDLLDLPTPELPPLTDFTIEGVSTSTQLAIINGKLSSQASFIYRLQPLREGILVIPPVSVNLDGKTYLTNPITVDVRPAASPSPSQLPPADGNSEREFFVEAEVDNQTPYLGQQIVYIFKFYQAVELIHRPDYQPPPFTNFWGQNVVSQPQYNTTINGRNYLVTEIHTALFPASIGPITIDPARLVIPGGLFEPDIALETTPITIEVQPLPPGAPPNFNGAVGQFTIHAALDQQTGVVNEPVTLELVIQGTGNIEVVTEPEFPDLPNWRIFDSQTKITVSVEDEVVVGERRFERLLVPGRPGSYTIPPISFSYFDPQAHEYRTISTDPLPIIVQAGDGQEDGGLLPVGPDQQAVTRLGDDIRHIKPAPTVLRSANQSVLNSPLYWTGWVVPVFLVAGVWLWQRRRRRLLADAALARRLNARKTAHKILAQARRPGADGYAIAQRGLLTYLSDKLNRPTIGLTRDALTRLLYEAGLSPALIDRVNEVLTQTDIGRFAPVDRSAADTMVEEARRLINELEKAL